jgi:hypothetical protein
VTGVDPRSLVPSCVDCGERVRPHTPGVFVEVTGWAENRGSAGGTHALSERKPTGRYLCSPCGKLRRAGVAPTQGALL